MDPDRTQVEPGTSDEWLSLQAASELLGVAASTVRRWADMGRLSMKRTLGGHRRFSRAAVMRLAESLPQEIGVVPNAAQPTWGVDERKLARQEWHVRLAERATSERMRELGQRLLGLLIQYINRPDETERFLHEAQMVGVNYGSEAREAGISMHDTVEAFLFFRSSFASFTIPIPGITAPIDLAEAAVLHARIDRFMDAILLGVISGYESRGT